MITPGRIPITLGIVGHRNADFTEQHENKLIGLFKDIQEKFSSSPVYLFSQLAEGADSDVARVFLDVKRDDDQLIVPIPIEEKRYIISFGENSPHADTFGKLKKRAGKYFTLEQPTPGSTDEELFRLGGKFVADSAIILIVLWDGKESNAMGGTAETYYYKTQGSFEGGGIDTIFEKQSKVVLLPCNRGTGKKQPVLPKGKLLDVVSRDLGIFKALVRIEQLNNAANNIRPEKLEKSDNYLFPNKSTLSDADRYLLSAYTLTDTLAIENQSIYFKDFNRLFILGALIVVAFEIYKHLDLTRVSLGLTLLLLFAALALSKKSKRGKNHSKFIEYRVLAEALRIQFFWNLGDVKCNVADYILRIYKAEYDWIKLILNAVNGVTYQDGPIKQDFHLVQKHWLDDQFNYFSSKLDKTATKRKKYNTWSEWSFRLAILLLIFMLVFHDCLLCLEWLHPMIVVSGVLLGSFALLKAYVETKGFHQTENQFTLMKEIYKATGDKITDMEKSGTATPAALTELFFQAGKEALIENGNWFLIFKDKEPHLEGVG